MTQHYDFNIRSLQDITESEWSHWFENENSVLQRVKSRGTKDQEKISKKKTGHGSRCFIPGVFLK